MNARNGKVRVASGIVATALSVVAAALGGEALPWTWEGEREFRSGDPY